MPVTLTAAAVRLVVVRPPLAVTMPVACSPPGLSVRVPLLLRLAAVTVPAAQALAIERCATVIVPGPTVTALTVRAADDDRPYKKCQNEACAQHETSSHTPAKIGPDDVRVVVLTELAVRAPEADTIAALSVPPDVIPLTDSDAVVTLDADTAPVAVRAAVVTTPADMVTAPAIACPPVVNDVAVTAPALMPPALSVVAVRVGVDRVPLVRAPVTATAVAARAPVVALADVSAPEKPAVPAVTPPAETEPVADREPPVRLPDAVR